MTWHIRQSAGGIRTYGDAKLWEHDEAVYRKQMEVWKVKQETKPKYVNLDCGLGDHFQFLPVLKEMMAKRPDERVVVCACYPAAFEGIVGNYELQSVAHGQAVLGNNKFDEMNVFRYCMERNWKRPLADAFRELYKTT